MKRICIGVYVHAEPQRLLATLASLHANTRQAVELLLLPDGPNAETNSMLATLPEIPQLGTEQPLGTPACFNRLITATNADLLVLLESGTVVGPSWLDYLLAALYADPRNGIAGPSTNHCWNEQAVFPHSGDTLAEVARTAAAAALLFGLTWRTLTPLHSLGDFCYVVKREVVDNIGAADESYGLGPCWEMDYNIRAARAGFQAVWARAAYVNRAPFTARRRDEEERNFETSKQRYQNKFCALRQRGERVDYEPHCLGEECQHFALPELLQLHIPISSTTRSVAPTTTISIGETTPLVSCILPTRDRPDFLLQSIHYFQRQDYPARELIIIDDSVEDFSARLPNDPRIRYLRLPPGKSIGTKRNWACELARGNIIAQWDDDDWYAPNRLSRQVAPLISDGADISGLQDTVFFDLPHWGFWKCTPALHRRMFVEDVHGGTLVYRRRVWERLARYPDRSLAEDADFLRQ
ncbi:MAG: glycosyltransferase, partial [Acidobacteriota bacterium]